MWLLKASSLLHRQNSITKKREALMKPDVPRSRHTFKENIFILFIKRQNFCPHIGIFFQKKILDQTQIIYFNTQAFAFVFKFIVMQSTSIQLFKSRLQFIQIGYNSCYTELPKQASSKHSFHSH